MPAEPLLPVEFLTTTRLGKKGELTVPSEYRDELHLESGAQVAVLRLGDGLLLIPEQTHFNQLCDRIAGAFASQGVSAAELLASLPKARRKVFERHYPELAQTEKTRATKSGKKKAA